MKIHCHATLPVAACMTAMIALTPGVRAEDTSAAKQITADYMRAQVAKLSADEFEGRGTAAPGGEKAGDYLIEQLKSLGYEPAAGANGWKQPFDIIGIKSAVPEQWVFSHGDRNLPLKRYEEFLASSGVQKPQSTIKNAEVVFVGYGIQAPEFQWDDFKGQNLKGKVLLMLNNDPDWDPQLFAGNTRLYYGRWTYKYESAARQGAAGAIVIHTTPSAGYPFQVLQASSESEKFELPAKKDEPRVQVEAWVTEDAAKELVALAGQELGQLVEAAKKRDFAPVPLGIRTSMSFANEVSQKTSFNVFGLLRGSDPALRDEAVIYTAHHDHLGIATPDAEGDNIYNGALDNGAGMAQLLAIAKAFKALPAPPRRSILILFVGAEEQNLLGSEYFATHPTLPAGKIAANINYDGGNIWGRARDIAFIGKGKSTLDAIVERHAALQGRAVKPDQYPDRGHFYRSDQFNFARIGVPALYLDIGTEFIGRPAGWGQDRIEEFENERYHQPSDEIDDGWNFDGMIDDARLGFYVGLEIANADELPAWVPGDEFEAARKAALAAVRE
ncbi:MAG: M28 family peptidase [Gammaproteobacteria bacterium]|nr:M28 family peptidase [Gammaproteobacteria bacterium]